MNIPATADTLDAVKGLIGEVLGIEDRARQMDASTGLLGDLPELDSMAVVALLAALEDHFGVTLDDSDITADNFETVGALADYVEGLRS
jgi:acyl carrier protein